MKTKTRILAILLAALMIEVMLIPISVFAEDRIIITKSGNINSDYKFWGSEMVDYTFTYADGSQVTAHIGGFDLHYAGENVTTIVGSQIAYCIEPNASSTNGTYYTGSSAENDAYWSTKLSQNQRYAIRLILLYGAPNTLKSNDNNTLFGMEGATQVLIWEIVMGLRSPVAPYTLLDARLKNHFYNNTAHPAIKSAYDSIVQKMQTHLTIPSFASHFAGSAPTYSLNYDSSSGLYKCSLTDTNGVLSQDYNFSAPGITMTKSGNTLNISAPASALAGGAVTASATGQSLSVDSMTQMIWTLPNKQTVTTFSASPDPAPCYFKLEISRTSLDIVKQSSDGNVANIAFTVKDSSGNTLFTGRTNSAGRLTVPDLTVGQTVTVTETVPDNYEVDQRTRTITLAVGTNTLTFKNYPKGTMTIAKSSDEGDVEGYCFKLYQWSVNKSWYGKSDASGKVYVTDQNYAASGTKVYTFNGLTDGKYTFLEVLSKHGKDLVFPDSIRITVKNKGVTKYDHSFTGAELTKDSNGDCRVDQVQLTGLSDGGVMTVTVHNTPEEDNLEIVKTSEDGNVAGITFKVEQFTPGGIGWWTMGNYVTDDTGKIVISGLNVGAELRATEIVPDGYECTSQNPQQLTISHGTNRLSFTNRPKDTSLEIVKTCADGNIGGISFRVEKYEAGGIGWYIMGNYTTNSSGKITVSGLYVGDRLRVTETVPANYTCSSTNPQEIVLTEGTNRVSFTNVPVVSLEIVKTSDDGLVYDISFLVEQWTGSNYVLVGVFETGANGKIDIPNPQWNTRYRITETVPANYVSENRIQTITTVAGLNTVTFVNHPVSSLEIVKTSDDGNIYDITFLVEQWTGSAYATVGSFQTGVNGKVNVPNLQWNTRYRVTEIVPANYVSENRVQEITTVTGKNTVTFVNHPIAELEIVKTAEDGNNSGIGFEVQKYQTGSGWQDFGTFTTNSAGIITIPDLEAGTRFRITELVPAGYVSEQHTQEVVIALGTNTVSFHNRLIRGSLKIVKLDAATQIPLQGAVFRVCSAGGSTIAQRDTDENGEVVFPELLYGEYSYQEVSAPDGFALDETVYSFSILEDGAVIEVTRENQPQQGSLNVYKVDEAGRPLSGVEFLLEYSTDDGSTWAPVQHRSEDEPVQAGFCTSDGLTDGMLRTDASGQAGFTGLCIDTQLGAVRYRITEVATKDGYTLLPDYAFDGSLRANEALEIPITVVNQPVFSMPATGGKGFNSLAIGLVIIGMIAAAVLILRRKGGKADAC